MRREFSAGGVVVRDSAEGAEVALVSPRTGVYALPKGHPDPGETMKEAATREVREETGITAEPLDELGEVRYWYRLEGERVLKSVTFYLFRYLAGDVGDHDDEVVWAGWVPLDEAPEQLTYEGERAMVVKALARSGT